MKSQVKCDALFDSAMLWLWMSTPLATKENYPIEDMTDYDASCHLCEVTADEEECTDCPMFGEWPNLDGLEVCSARQDQLTTPVDLTLFTDDILIYDRCFFALLSHEYLLKTWEEYYD